jgi:hypothetical protein
MERGFRTHARVFALLAVLSLAIDRAWSFADEPSRAQASERYIRAHGGGAKLLNYRDVQSSVWRTLSEGDLMRVTGEQILEPPGQPKLVFLEVEVPGGLPVWVFGQYLAPTGTEGVLQTTTSVRMRPKPSSDQSSMAHPMTLKGGERVRFIERSNESKPMSEDWVKVWSPESARAWVLETETEPVTDVDAAREEWTRTSAELRAELAASNHDVSEQPVVATPASAPMQDDAAKLALEEARQLHQAAIATPGASYAETIAAYERALEVTPKGSSIRSQAQAGLHEAQIQAGFADLQAVIDSHNAERDDLLADYKREQELEARSKDPLWGRFLARGWVVRRDTKEGPTYYLNWRTDDVCEIVCTAGRYDLAVFEGFEVGVMGTTSRGALPASDAGPAKPQLLDLYRIEVISGAGPLH